MRAWALCSCMRYSRSVFKVTSNFFPIIAILSDKKTPPPTWLLDHYRSRLRNIAQIMTLATSQTLSGSQRLPILISHIFFLFWSIIFNIYELSHKEKELAISYHHLYNVICRFSLLAQIHDGAVKYKLFRFCPRLETWINVLSISWIHYATRNCIEYTFLSFFGWTRRYIWTIQARKYTSYKELQTASRAESDKGIKRAINSN